MKKAIAWEIGDGAKPERLGPGQVDLEKHLEDWIEHDIGIIADDVLLVGRQVMTAYGTQLDLLGIDVDGNLVVIELKRSQTLRETVAQGLEYAAWVSRLGYEDVMALVAKRFGSETAFRDAFAKGLGAPLPETLNAGQRILLVAPEIADSTAAVIGYLSETYNVPINAVSFDLFALDSRQVLVRHFVLETSEVPTPPNTKKGPELKEEKFRELAAENGLADVLDVLVELKDILPIIHCTPLRLGLHQKAPDGRLLVGLSIYLAPDQLVVHVAPVNLSALYGRTVDGSAQFVQDLQSLGTALPPHEGGRWMRIGLSSPGQADELARRFRAFAASTSPAPGAVPE